MLIHFPDVGGWIVIGAAMLAFGVWFAEWYHHHRSEKKATMSFKCTGNPCHCSYADTYHVFLLNKT